MPRSLPAVSGATPYAWPYHGDLRPEQLALVACLDERWRPAGVAAGRVDTSLAALASAVQAVGGIVVGVVPPAAAVQPVAGGTAAPPGAALPIRCDELVVAPAVDGFHGTPLDQILRAAGRTDLLLAGWGLEGPVHSTLRSANDRGYECLLVSDSCAAVDPDLAASALDMVRHSGGIFGAFADTPMVLSALDATRPASVPEEPPMSEPTVDTTQVDASPYPWPYDQTLLPERTALVLIDWQVDFCGPGGYVDQMGYDLSLTRARPRAHRGTCSRPCAPGAAPSSTRARATAPTCRTAPPTSSGARSASARASATRVPAGASSCGASPAGRSCPRSRRSTGRSSSTSRARAPSTPPTSTSSCATRGITHLVLTGITTDVCVHTTMREANDRGYECLLLTDCTGATDPGNYAAAIEMVKMQGGVFGAVAPSGAFLAALAAQLEAASPTAPAGAPA